MSKTIGILSNNQSPATDVYRSIHPFSKLGYETVVVDPEKAKWYELYRCDILVVSRPNGSLIHNLMEEFKRMGVGKKVIVDMDDNLHKLDPSNPSYGHFSIQPVKDSVVACLNLADHIIYSTKNLQKFYEPLHAFTESTVVPNAIDFDLTPMIPPRPLRPSPNPMRVLWRGSEHHKKDLETIRPFWNWILSEENKGKYEVMFMGLQAHDVHTYFPDALCIPWNPSPFAYWSKVADLNADVAVFPLEKTAFNDAKSNIFALEMLVNGVLPIVPNGFDEFIHLGNWIYNDSNHLIGTLKELGQTDRIERIKRGQTWIRENRSLEAVNAKRKEIIEGL